MYIGRQIKSLLETALLTGKDQWINIKETRDAINEFINSKREFSVDELVGMVRLTDGEVMAKDQMVKDLRFKIYFNPSSNEQLFNEMEKLFKGHVMVLARKASDGKFVIEKASNPIK